MVCFFLFKQKTADEMRISDWSSDGGSADLHAVGRAFGDRSTQHDLDPEFFECLARIGRKILWKDRQQTRASLDQYNPRCARVDRAEVTRQRVSCQLGDGSGQFNPGGTTTDDDERLQRGTLLRIARALSFLERDRKSTRLNSSH